MHKTKILFLLFLPFIFAELKAEIAVTVSDSLVKTDYITIPIKGITGDFSGKTVEYSFQLNWIHFNLLGIVPNSDYALKNGDFSYSLDENRVLTVKSNSISSNFDGTLFGINFQLLPRVDFFQEWENSLTIEPKTVRFYGNGIDSTVILAPEIAYIKIDSLASNQTFAEKFSLNYPNPFSFETIIFFSIFDETPVKIHVHNFGGQIIQEIPAEIDGAFQAEFYDSKNNKIEITNDYKFKKGLYKLILRVNRGKIYATPHRLLFETNNQKSSLNILIDN